MQVDVHLNVHSLSLSPMWGKLSQALLPRPLVTSHDKLTSRMVKSVSSAASESECDPQHFMN